MQKLALNTVALKKVDILTRSHLSTNLGGNSSSGFSRQILRFFQRGTVLTMLLTVIFTVSKAQDTLRIKGNISKNLDGKIITIKTIYPFHTALSPNATECVIRDGKFSLVIPAKGLEQYQLSFKGHSSGNDGISLVLMPERTEISILDTNLTKYTIVGNNAQSEYHDSIIPIINRRLFTEPEIDKAVINWIENHSESPLNAYLIITQLSTHLQEAEIIRLSKIISPTQCRGTYYNELNFITNNLYVGQLLPDFTQKDLNGNLIKLSSFRGKYILVDFWASWCGPCRAENPWLIEARKKYGQQKFDIISVSLDDSRDNWIEAIQKDKLQDWTHVSDLKGWQNSVSVNYRISAVPRNFLIDGNGKIIAKNLRGTELLSELTKLIK